MNTLQFDEDGNVQVISWDRAFEPVVQKMNDVVSQIDGVNERLNKVKYYKPTCDNPNSTSTGYRCGKHRVGGWSGRETCQKAVSHGNRGGLCVEDIDGKLRHYFNGWTLGDIP